jgi:hypothetical protein
MFGRQELQIHRRGNLLILNHTNYTHSDSVQNRSVVNDMKYNNHDKNNRCSVIFVSLESYALVKKAILPHNGGITFYRTDGVYPPEYAGVLSFSFCVFISLF